jgi:hypothetical protein
MLIRIGAHVTYANVTATAALFVALGGVSYAAIRLPPGSVGTRQIRDGAVTRSKIDPVTRRALAGRTGPAGLNGAPGVNGAAGPKGDPGSVGAAGSALAYAHVNDDGTFDPARSKNVIKSALFSTGIYCLSFSVTPSNVAATLVGVGVNGQIGTFYDPTTNGCTIGANVYQIKIATSDAAGTSTNRSFDVLVN